MHFIVHLFIFPSLSFFFFFLILYAPKFDRYLPTSFLISLVLFQFLSSFVVIPLDEKYSMILCSSSSRMTRQLSRYPNDVKIAWALIVSPLLHRFNYRIRPISTNSREIKYFRNERARFGINAISRLFFFPPPPPLFSPVYYSRYLCIILLSPPQISTYYFVTVLYIYICMYITSLPPWGQKNRRENSSDGSTPPDNLSLIRDDLAIIQGEGSHDIFLLQSKFISALLHTRTHAAVYI